ncbi:unnamed protein product, partial [Brassica rapa]
VYDLCHDRCACLAGHKPLIKSEFLLCGGLGDGTGLVYFLSSARLSLPPVCVCVRLTCFLHTTLCFLHNPNMLLACHII